MKEKLKDSRILWETIKVFFAVERSFYYFLTIITGVAIAKFARVLNFGNDIKIDGRNSVEGMKSAAGQIIFFDMIELIGYRITDYLTDVCFVKQQTRVGVLAFRTILRDSSLDLDLRSGKIQYFIRQGGLGMAKLLKNVVFFIFSEVIEMIFTLYFLGFSNKASIIPLFTLTICSLLIILAHLKVTEYKIKCKRDTNISLVECDKVLYELLLNYDSIKSNSMEEKEIAKYYSKLKMYERSFIIYGRFEDILDFFHTSSFIFTKGALMVYTFRHNDNPSELSSSLRTLMKSTKNIDSISSKTGSIYRKVKEGFLNARMAFDYIKEESHSDNNLEISSFKKSITFENVDIFAKKVKILVDLNFEIKQGQKVAFIGKNGRGKSTLFKTLLKLQNFTGKIEIDGIPINKINEQSYRDLFAYLPQNNFLFDDTIKNNMLYGVKHKVTDDLIYDLSEELNLHDSIMALKNEYNTVSGERGENLSGGQRQKILIIRALLRNAQIYLFDEPFNNLDKESTHSFINMIKSERFKDKTVIMIIHSPEMLYLFDRVIDIDTNSVIKNIKTK